jgi:hypothetical protein
MHSPFFKLIYYNFFSIHFAFCCFYWCYTRKCRVMFFTYLIRKKERKANKHTTECQSELNSDCMVTGAVSEHIGSQPLFYAFEVCITSEAPLCAASQRMLNRKWEGVKTERCITNRHKTGATSVMYHFASLGSHRPRRCGQQFPSKYYRSTCQTTLHHIPQNC